MIVSDTHIWIWWIDGNTRLTENQQQLIQTHQTGYKYNFLLGSCQISRIGSFKIVVPN